MKSLVFLAALFFTQSASARQYIQCSVMGDTTDVAVVNLTTETNGTLFLSSGMQNDESERILVEINLSKVENGFHHYKVINEVGTGYAVIPSDVIGAASRFFTIQIAFASLSFDYGCFSAIYPDTSDLLLK